MLRGVHIKINFSLSLSRVDLKVVPAEEEIVVYHLQFFSNFFERPLFYSWFFFKKAEIRQTSVYKVGDLNIEKRD